MADLNVDVFKAIRKLEGERNYSTWVRDIKIALLSKDRIYWHILTGRSKAPEEPYYYATSRTEVLPLLENEAEAGDTPTPTAISEAILSARIKELEQLNKALKAEYVKARNKFLRKDSAVLCVLYSTLEIGPLSRIRGIRTAYEAFSILESAFGKKAGLPIAYLFNEWQSVKYKETYSHISFLERFRAALANLRCQVEVPEWLEYCTFFNAIVWNPSLQTFIRHNMPQNDGFRVAKVYYRFRNFEDSRKFFARSQSANNASESRRIPREMVLATTNVVDEEVLEVATAAAVDVAPLLAPHHATAVEYDEDYNSIYCPYHKSYGNHKPSACRLKSR